MRFRALFLLALLFPGNTAAEASLLAANAGQGASGNSSDAPDLIVQDPCSPRWRTNSGQALLRIILFPWSAFFGYSRFANVAEIRGPYEASPQGLARLVVDICAAKRAQNDAALDRFFNGLILPDHEVWMSATFGATMGKRIAATYSRERAQVPALFSSAFTAFIEEGATRAIIHTLDEDFVHVVGYFGTPSVNLWKQLPERLYEVRIMSDGRPTPNSRRQFIFAHVEGGFRYLGTLEPAPAAPEETLAAPAPDTEVPRGVGSADYSGSGMSGGVLGGVPGGVPGGVVGGVIGGVIGEPPAATEPPPPTSKTRVQTVRVGGGGMQSKLIRRVDPAYPPLARQAHVSGVVLLEVTVARDGSVQAVRVLRGHPLLTASAIAAVKQWQYVPTLLNGEAVQVITIVTLNFQLSTPPPE